ncbi:MAG: hypothetical protein RBU25_07895, partial [Lentisphaeria bacterium]|nr:hypothetical protein [Lentisphaeria bacterium]
MISRELSLPFFAQDITFDVCWADAVPLAGGLGSEAARWVRAELSADPSQFLESGTEVGVLRRESGDVKVRFLASHVLMSKLPGAEPHAAA